MKDIESVIKELTLDEKLSLLEGADMGFTMPVERLGIPRILMVDGPHGVRVVKGTCAASGEPYTMNGEMEQATAFPCEAAAAATWNTSLIRASGEKMGEECRHFGVGVLLGPGADGKRSPLGGRNFEYYSEDPYLSGKMAAAFIRGIQSQGVGACMKHYVLNDQETRRMSVDVHVDERTLREIYVKPFEIAVKEADPWAIMASYNKEGGTYITENTYLLDHMLRGELQYEGTVISDWSAVKNKLASVKAGLDIQMPGPSGQIPALKEAVETGELSEAIIDCHVRRVLELVEKVTGGSQLAEVDWEEHHRLAQQIAEEGMVLLKNQEQILPIAPDATVAVIGELAQQPNFAGSGSATLLPKQLDIPLEELRKVRKVVYAQGYHINTTSEEMLREAQQAAADADVAVLFLGNVRSEGMDRTTLALPEAQLQLIQRVAGVNPNLVLVVMSGSAVEYVEVEPLARAILHTWIPGEGGGAAIANLLTGKSNPSGKLSETFPLYLENTPAYENFPGFKDDVYYHEGILTGYRYYDSKKIPVQYPFGYGLSYTTFAYGHMRLSAADLKEGEKLTVFVDVTNTGSRWGQESVQVYVADKESYLFRPEKELKGFAKVALQPGETKTVTVVLEYDAFAYYVPSLHKFAVESGDFDILVAASASDIRCRDTVHVSSTVDVRSPLQESDLFIEFLQDDRYRTRAEALLDKLHMEENHPFYHLVLGGSLTQFLGLGDFLQMDEQTARSMVDELLDQEGTKRT
jgi:beta-glucosidase